MSKKFSMKYLAIGLLLFLTASVAFAQNLTVTGKVLDESGQPVIGAAVVVKGNALNGTVTDADGSFKIVAAPDAVAQISCIGYETAEVPFAGRSIITVTLKEDSTLLDDVVVVGYGQQKKVNLSGAVSMVKMDELAKDRPVPNAAAALQGAIPGLYVYSTANGVDDTKNFQIRASQTYDSPATATRALSVVLSPLVLVDNVPADINALNPDDIESISVLKDASASAIYGSRAAAGVILITTKRSATNEKAKVNYSGSVSVGQAIYVPQAVDLLDYIDIMEEASGTNTWTPGDNVQYSLWRKYAEMYQGNRSGLSSLGTLRDNGLFYSNEDGKAYFLDNNGGHYADLYETAVSQDHNVSVYGGTNKVRYRFAANSHSKDGPLSGDRDIFSRKVISGFLSADIAKWLTQEATVYYTNTHKEASYLSTVMTNAKGAFVYSQALSFLPSGTSYDKDGNAFVYKTPANMLAQMPAAITDVDRPRVFTKTILKPVKGLSINFEFNYEKAAEQIDSKITNYSWRLLSGATEKGPAHQSYTFTSNDSHRTSYNVYANYNVSAGKHNFGFTAGYNQELYGYVTHGATAEDFSDSQFIQPDKAEGKVTPAYDTYEDAFRGVFGRFNYNYDEKYIFEASARYDGSSYFPKGHRFGFFPSMSAAWNIAREGFMQDVSWVDMLKLRVSYGSIGDNVGAKRFGYIADITKKTGQTNWLVNNNYINTLSVPLRVSEDYTWSSMVTKDLGFDWAFFGNRLTGTFDVYQRENVNILAYAATAPNVLGVTAPLENIGTIETNGFEFQINWRGNIGPKAHYNIGFNISDYMSTAVKVTGNPAKNFDMLFSGRVIGDMYGFVTDGYHTIEDFKTTSPWVMKDEVPCLYGNKTAYRPGDQKFKDLDGDGSITYGGFAYDNLGDLTIIGNDTPRYQYGINLGADYAGLALSVFIQGIGKRDYFAQTPISCPFVSGGLSTPLFKGEEDRWMPISTDPSSPDFYQPVNPNPAYPRYYATNGSLPQDGRSWLRYDKYVVSARYFRVKNVTLSYTLPKSWLESVKIDDVRFYLSAENLLTISPLHNIDPETLVWGYPAMRNVSFGVNITL